MRLICDKGNWCLRKDVKKGKVWRNENVICFGRDKPTFSSPLILHGDSRGMRLHGV